MSKKKNKKKQVIKPDVPRTSGAPLPEGIVDVEKLLLEPAPTQPKTGRDFLRLALPTIHNQAQARGISDLRILGLDPDALKKGIVKAKVAGLKDGKTEEHIVEIQLKVSPPSEAYPWKEAVVKFMNNPPRIPYGADDLFSGLGMG